MGHESHVEGKTVERAEKKGWLAFKVIFQGVRAAPDRWFFKRKRKCPTCGNCLDLRVVEFKKFGEEPRLQQRRRHKELRKHGVEVDVIDNTEDGYALFD